MEQGDKGMVWGVESGVLDLGYMQLLLHVEGDLCPCSGGGGLSTYLAWVGEDVVDAAVVDLQPGLLGRCACGLLQGLPVRFFVDLPDDRLRPVPCSVSVAGSCHEAKRMRPTVVEINIEDDYTIDTVLQMC